MFSGYCTPHHPVTRVMSVVRTHHHVISVLSVIRRIWSNTQPVKPEKSRGRTEIGLSSGTNRKHVSPPVRSFTEGAGGVTSIEPSSSHSQHAPSTLDVTVSPRSRPIWYNTQPAKHRESRSRSKIRSWNGTNRKYVSPSPSISERVGGGVSRSKQQSDESSPAPHLSFSASLVIGRVRTPTTSR